MLRVHVLLVSAPLVLASWACNPCDLDCELVVDAGVAPLPELQTIVFRSSPQRSDALVFSSNADLSLIESKRLGPDGSVEIQVREGGMLSLLEGNARLHSLVPGQFGSRHTPRPPEIFLPIPMLAEDKSYRFTPSLTATADRHHFYACQDEAILGTQSQEVSLAISNDCLTGDSFQLIAIAVREDRPIAYAHASIAYDFEGPAIEPLVWQTDLREQSFSVIPPPLLSGTTLGARAFFGQHELAMLGPALRFDGGLSKIGVPPELPEPSWYEITLRRDGLFQSYLGPLPNQGSEWFAGPTDAEIGYAQESQPYLVWKRSLLGDFQRGFCEATDLPTAWRWNFYGSPDLTFIGFPRLPEELTDSAFPTQPLESGQCQVSAVDYVEYEGAQRFTAAMQAGRLAWTASSSEFNSYIQTGQSIAIAGVTVAR